MYKPIEFAKKIGVNVTTLRNWEKKGILIANRTPTNRRFYTDEHYKQYLSSVSGIDIDYDKEISNENLKIVLRLEIIDNKFKVEIQHTKSKDFLLIKEFKTYKNAMLMIKRRKADFESIGLKVEVVKKMKMEE